jgi:hypothetical protein
MALKYIRITTYSERFVIIWSEFLFFEHNYIIPMYKVPKTVILTGKKTLGSETNFDKTCSYCIYETKFVVKT